MLEFVLNYNESEGANTADSSVNSQARFQLALRDELAALIWANEEFDRRFGSRIGLIAADAKAQQQQFHPNALLGVQKLQDF